MSPYPLQQTSPMCETGEGKINLPRMRRTRCFLDSRALVTIETTPERERDLDGEEKSIMNPRFHGKRVGSLLKLIGQLRQHQRHPSSSKLEISDTAVEGRHLHHVQARRLRVLLVLAQHLDNIADGNSCTSKSSSISCKEFIHWESA
ncbi:hypothetical protein MPTK1_5g07510 [Marchantia polymorpha subsp. ruderalis]|uniref:Uncharacterized protein n=2 Tax=Marchantia polymorpha TaxID=3197 RepID=A0AAF6BFY0_MARPO|nr:hypothetical protein MARPO_0127s0033 [Marchantia polymorpha]BBN10914.1 hypothetical protein Mp_5g07510 [Marchantia polymorpha subsp. ruderalis]|eukprot:PTQ30250.1 hypothetical protein MARPO_0127s0033 [Marchantia polymorpha]